MKQRWERGRIQFRKEELSALAAVDAFGLREAQNESQKSLVAFLDQGYPFRIYKEQIAKLLNAAATDLISRDYFLASKDDHFLPAVCKAMMAEERDTVLRQNLLGVLEKMSIR